MKVIRLWCLSSLFIFVIIQLFAQSKMLTISHAADLNITTTTPHQPIDPSFDANLNINTLLNSLTLGNTEVNDGIFFDYEIIVHDDVQYYSPFHLTIYSNNNVLVYAHVVNDTSGNLNLFASDRVVVGTGINWLPVYSIPIPVHPPLLERPVQAGSLKGSTNIDAGINACVVAPAMPASESRLGLPQATMSANIYIYSGNHILIHGGGPMSPAIVGFGNDALVGNVDCPIELTCEEGNLHLIGGTDFAYARIGNQNSGDQLIKGKIVALVNSVPVNLPFNGNVFVEGGTGFGSEAQIGHSHLSATDFINISAPVLIDADGSVDLKAGSAMHTRARIGHHLRAKHLVGVAGPIAIRSGQNIFLNSRLHMTGDSAFTQIGHWVQALGGSAIDSIYLEVGEYDGYVGLFGGDTTARYAMVGHSAAHGSLNLSGNINMIVQSNIEIHAGLGAFSFGQVGHRQIGSNTSGATGAMDIKSGESLIVSSRNAQYSTSSARIGHYVDNYSGQIDILVGDDVWLMGDTSGMSGIYSEIETFDDISVTSGDSIVLIAHTGNAIINTEASNTILSLKALAAIVCRSEGSAESMINANNGQLLELMAGESIELMQSDITISSLNGTIYLESDRDYQLGDLWQPLVFSGIGSNPLTASNLNGSSPIQSADDLGVIRFNNQSGPCQLKTQSGNIHVLSKSIDASGVQYDLKISSIDVASLDPVSQNGKILIGMQFSPPSTYVDIPTSYEKALINNWNTSSMADLFLNVNAEIDVLNSSINLKSSLLLTDTAVP
jgi:hypothetical protein